MEAETSWLWPVTGWPQRPAPCSCSRLCWVLWDVGTACGQPVTCHSHEVSASKTPNSQRLHLAPLRLYGNEEDPLSKNGLAFSNGPTSDTSKSGWAVASYVVCCRHRRHVTSPPSTHSLSFKPPLAPQPDPSCFLCTLIKPSASATWAMCGRSEGSGKWQGGQQIQSRPAQFSP